VAGFTTVTELADTLVRKAHLPFRQAHSIVSGMVTHALEHKLAPHELTADLLTQIAQEKLGKTVTLSDDDLREALDPVAFVAKRNGYGGSSPISTATILDELEARLKADEKTLKHMQAKLATAKQKLNDAVNEILQTK
jgi:argininosuccinate lyase